LRSDQLQRHQRSARDEREGGRRRVTPPDPIERTRESIVPASLARFTEKKQKPHPSRPRTITETRAKSVATVAQQRMAFLSDRKTLMTLHRVDYSWRRRRKGKDG